MNPSNGTETGFEGVYNFLVNTTAIMTEESSTPLSNRMRTLEENLNLFIDFSMQTQRSQQLQIDTLVEGQRELTQAMQNLIDFQREVVARIDTVTAQVGEMQSEVRGLQTENRRILDILLNQEPPETDEG